MCNNNCGCNNGLFNNCPEWLIILILLYFFCNCGGCNWFGGSNNNSGCGCGCGCNPVANNNCGCGCDNNCGCC